MFDVDQFIADLRNTLAERSREAMKEVVARAVSDPASLLGQIGYPEQGAVQVLYRASDLTVLNVIWSPNQISLPHDHRMSAVIGMYGGREDNMIWRRVRNPVKFQIEAAGGKALGPGDVALLGRDVIHSVVNPLAKLSGANHVYDGDFVAAQRSMWNSETLIEEPYDITAVLKVCLYKNSRLEPPIKPAKGALRPEVALCGGLRPAQLPVREFRGAHPAPFRDTVIRGVKKTT